MKCASKLVILVLTLTTLVCASEWHNQIDLNRILHDSTALDKLLIKYDIAGYQTLLFYGTGKVMRHVYTSLPNSTNSTCTGAVEQAEINKLLEALVKLRFFEMPLRRYAIRSRSLDGLRELKLHSIMIDDGTTRSSRQFAAGTYQGHQERIPKKFAAVESVLRNLADAALASHTECDHASSSTVQETKLPTLDSESASADDLRQ